MLTHIHIKNFVLIDTLDLEFSKGFTVLTGETGAGKSIIIDALDLALGNRADQQVIRHGADRCEIVLSFDLKNIPAAQQWLATHELNHDLECIIRRIISNDGRSRVTINGTSCSLQMVRELSELLVNIHGQHEQQTLLKREQQRQVLDSFADHLNLTQQVRQLYQQWRDIKNQLEQSKHAADQQAKLDLLRYQVQELQELALGENEISELEQEHKKLANAEQLLSNANQALSIIADNDNGAVIQALHTAAQHLQQVKNLDTKINNAAQLINDAIIQTEEASSELRHYIDALDLNAERLQWLEQRLDQIYRAARKHRIHVNELPNFIYTLKAELHALENWEQRSEILQTQLTAVEQQYNLIAKQLTQSRQQAAKKLEKAVTQHLQTLGMPGGKFAIQFETLQDCNVHGVDRIEFLVSANPGQPLQPLHKIASGGELSRISLAIQVITAQQEDTPTLIFDEVDVGIGGGTAEIVGKLLRQLGKQAQVLCITHLPQVAAQGQQHLQVKKLMANDTTIAQIQTLTTEEKIAEIARMLGGVKISAQTLAHAREMINLTD